MADRRMLWKNVSQSRKVNSLSDRAAIIWTWAIPWFDRDGLMEAESDWIKMNVVPRRSNISEAEIPNLRSEIVKSGLWTLFKDENGVMVVKENGFSKRQSIEYKRECKSKWEGKTLIPTDNSRNSDVIQPVTRPEVKLREEKLKETPPTPPSGCYQSEREVEKIIPKDALKPLESTRHLFRFCSRCHKETLKSELQNGICQKCMEKDPTFKTGLSHIRDILKDI